ncbi:SUMF1/EgtB/PvdO family nonheme iron enzyme [Nocardia panacis]|nr:SUMF1/EgtB/PvdO family nonheme iron enzyme [Nocardia panacis]
MSDDHVLITGAAGFIGSHMCRALLTRGARVTGIDNLSTGSLSNLNSLTRDRGFVFRQADVAGSVAWADLTAVTHVLHLACPASPKANAAMPIETMRAATLGTINALELAARAGARAVVASSSEVYGDPQVHPQHEDYRGNCDPVGPFSAYTEGKRATEAIAAAAHRRGVNVGVMRPFNVYGPGMRPDDGRVVASFCAAALRGETLRIEGGTQTRSLCYIDDFADAVLTLLLESATFGPINLGSSDEVTIADLARLVVDLAGTGHVEVGAGRAGEVGRRRPDTARAHNVLGWQASTPLREGITTTLEWMRPPSPPTGRPCRDRAFRRPAELEVLGRAVRPRMRRRHGRRGPVVVRRPVPDAAGTYPDPFRGSRVVDTGVRQRHRRPRHRRPEHPDPRGGGHRTGIHPRADGRLTMGESIRIPGGTVVIGAPEPHLDDLARAQPYGRAWFADEAPARTHTVSAFRLDRTPVTNAEYAAFVVATGYRTTAERRGESLVYGADYWVALAGACWHTPVSGLDAVADRPNHPVVHVDSGDAEVYACWAGKRLPTEAEWEYAAHGPVWTAWPWGPYWDRDLANTAEFWAGPLHDLREWRDWWRTRYDESGAAPATTDVGAYSPGGDSPFQIADMAGNVAEWTATTYHPYDPHRRYDPALTAAMRHGYRVIRGGSWKHLRYQTRTTERIAALPDYTSFDVGFRCAANYSTKALTPPTTKEHTL